MALSKRPYCYTGGEVVITLSLTDPETGEMNIPNSVFVRVLRAEVDGTFTEVVPRSEVAVGDSPQLVYRFSSTDTAGDYVAIFELNFTDFQTENREIHFSVVEPPLYSPTVKTLIDGLRLFLRDNKPYLFRVDEPIEHWDDEELYAFLYFALLDFNGSPPFWTSFTFETLPPEAYNIVVMGGAVMALIARSVLEAGNHFTYNDNGLSVTLARSQGYMSPAQMLLTQYAQGKKSLKRYIGLSTPWKGIKHVRAPLSIRRPLSMIPALENVFGR